mmetsp:Transcript_7149/g.16370  ORF Transcript_7149/g.16370 Transcript_7149/m.16370 type:complete len:165 (+) Transcript_7149:288-782(+)
MLNVFQSKQTLCAILVFLLQALPVSSFLQSLGWTVSCPDRASCGPFSLPQGHRICAGRSRSVLSSTMLAATAKNEPARISVAARDGHEIAVWKKGPEGGRPIVLLHGRTWSARPVWDLQVKEQEEGSGAEEHGAGGQPVQGWGIVPWGQHHGPYGLEGLARVRS